MNLPLASVSLSAFLALSGCAATVEDASLAPREAASAGPEASSKSVEPTMVAAAREGDGNSQAEPKKASDKKKAAKPSAAKSKAKAKAPSMKDLESALSKAQEKKAEADREARYAQADLEMAELASTITAIEIAESERSARAKLAAAQEAQARYDSEERPLELRRSALSLAEAGERLRKAETDLVGILEIFDDETEARSKDEIVRRHERSVDMAKERLALAEAEQGLKVDHEIPAKLKKLSGEVRSAESGVARAEAESAKRSRKAEVEIEKAADAVDAAKRKAKSANRAVEVARRKVNDRKSQGNGKANKARS